MEHFFERIDGWFNCKDLYVWAVDQAVDGAVFVEVGAWKGRSAAFMAVEILRSGKSIAFHVVDHFAGSREHTSESAIRDNTLLAEFLENMLPVKHAFTLHCLESTFAASHFPDGLIDFCYIDASHEYEDVKSDIQAWLPRMKPGAILAGDDYEYYPGVARAVDELLPGFTRDGNVWQYRCPSP